MNSWPRSKASRATVKFRGRSFSRRRYPPIYKQAEKGFIHFITLRMSSQGERTLIVPVYFADFFVFLFAELSTSFLISLSLASAEKCSYVFHDRLKV